jgi:adenosylhomocysteine nucleosidase
VFVTNVTKHHYKKVDYVIFSAMPEELEFFRDLFSALDYEIVTLKEFNFAIYEYNNCRVLLAHTGLGATFAASIITLIYHHFSPEFMLLSGTAGGIKVGLNIGDVVIAEHAFEAEIQGAFSLLKNTPFESCLTHPLNNQKFPNIYSADDELLNIARSVNIAEVKMHAGVVVSSNSFPAPKELFESIKCNNPYSIDMETSAFYQVGWLLKVRVLAVRGISNILNYDGTDENIHQSDVKGSAKAAANVVLKILDALILKYQAKAAVIKMAIV